MATRWLVLLGLSAARLAFGPRLVPPIAGWVIDVSGNLAAGHYLIPLILLLALAAYLIFVRLQARFRASAAGTDKPAI